MDDVVVFLPGETCQCTSPPRIARRDLTGSASLLRNSRASSRYTPSLVSLAPKYRCACLKTAASSSTTVTLMCRASRDLAINPAPTPLDRINGQLRQYENMRELNLHYQSCLVARLWPLDERDCFLKDEGCLME